MQSSVVCAYLSELDENASSMHFAFISLSDQFFLSSSRDTTQCTVDPPNITSTILPAFLKTGAIQTSRRGEARVRTAARGRPCRCTRSICSTRSDQTFVSGAAPKVASAAPKVASAQHCPHPHPRRLPSPAPGLAPTSRTISDARKNRTPAFGDSQETRSSTAKIQLGGSGFWGHYTVSL